MEWFQLQIVKLNAKHADIAPEQANLFATQINTISLIIDNLENGCQSGMLSHHALEDKNKACY